MLSVTQSSIVFTLISVSPDTRPPQLASSQRCQLVWRRNTIGEFQEVAWQRRRPATQLISPLQCRPDIPLKATHTCDGKVGQLTGDLQHLESPKYLWMRLWKKPARACCYFCTDVMVLLRNTCFDSKCLVPTPSYCYSLSCKSIRFEACICFMHLPV